MPVPHKLVATTPRYTVDIYCETNMFQNTKMLLRNDVSDVIVSPCGLWVWTIPALVTVTTGKLQNMLCRKWGAVQLRKYIIQPPAKRVVFGVGNHKYRRGCRD
jgi:hypothetical protein